jgi:hypothetical protein
MSASCSIDSSLLTEAEVPRPNEKRAHLSLMLPQSAEQQLEKRGRAHD